MAGYKTEKKYQGNTEQIPRSRKKKGERYKHVSNKENFEN